jgi:hypothetical protein
MSTIRVDLRRASSQTKDAFRVKSKANPRARDEVYNHYDVNDFHF